MGGAQHRHAEATRAHWGKGASKAATWVRDVSTLLLSFRPPAAAVPLHLAPLTVERYL